MCEQKAKKRVFLLSRLQTFGPRCRYQTGMSLRWSRFKGRASATCFVPPCHGGRVEWHMAPLYIPGLNSGLTLGILQITTLRDWPWPCLAVQRRGWMSCSLALVTVAQSCWRGRQRMVGLQKCCVTRPGWKTGLHANMSLTCWSHWGLTGMSSNILMSTAISASASSVSSIYVYILPTITSLQLSLTIHLHTVIDVATTWKISFYKTFYPFWVGVANVSDGPMSSPS